MLLLDEPDAFLPPVGVQSLLARLLNICLTRNWSLVLNTHSEEMIALSLEHESFTLVSDDQAGRPVASNSADDPMAATSLLSRPPVDTIVFAEDESACAFARGLLDAVDPMQCRRTAFLWGGGGDGYLRQLLEHLPRPPKPPVRFAFVFDGDQRGSVSEPPIRRWKAVFLPTDHDPDTLMMALAPEVERLAGRLSTDEARLSAFLASIEGSDPHDWVNRLAEEYGRPQVLQGLPAVWAELNTHLMEEFAAALQSALS